MKRQLPSLSAGTAPLSRRGALAALVAPLMLAACGFRPAYAPGGLHGRIRADDPADRYGFEFLRQFEQRLGTPEAPAYALGYRIEVRQEGVAGASAASTTRFQLRGRVLYAARDIATGRELFRDSASSFTGYSALDTTIAEQGAEDGAWRRLIDQLADQVVTGLTASYASWGQAAGASGLPAGGATAGQAPGLTSGGPGTPAP